MGGHPRPESGFRPEYPDSAAGAQPAAVPILDADPTRTDLPTDANDDPVPILYMSDGSTGVTGSGGDVVLAAPNGSDGVDTSIIANVSGSISLGVDSTGLL